jgi:hypothetical protein
VLSPNWRLGRVTWVRAYEMVPLAATWRDLIQPFSGLRTGSARHSRVNGVYTSPAEYSVTMYIFNRRDAYGVNWNATPPVVVPVGPPQSVVP